ncbi:hypothetical protein PG993_003861 [Apiospora rasikravindrae]|uniref:Apple domain-containing protein n=1 Tax=Apiospora rasikravindrae TaxID=990691 RepID=A0ABR1U2X9_9PEZI
MQALRDGMCSLAKGWTRDCFCTGDEFTKPKGGTLCCHGGSAMAVDAATNEADCCPKGKVYSNRAFTDPPPAVSCPESHTKTIWHKGVQFQVWCGYNIIEYVNPFDFGAKISAVMNMNKRGQMTAQNCLDICAADPKCQGTNWWWGKGLCGINNKPQGGSLFSRGGDYKNPRRCRGWTGTSSPWSRFPCDKFRLSNTEDAFGIS